MQFIHPISGAASGQGQIVHGTIAVVLLEPHRLIIAADSRHNFGHGSEAYGRDIACKITALGDHAVFVAAGFIGYEKAGERDRLSSWRAGEEARSVFVEMVRDRGEWKDQYLESLATAIGDRLVARVSEFVPYQAQTLQQAAVGGLLTTALIATGRGPDIRAAVVQVAIDEQKRVHATLARHVTTPICPPCALGRGEVVLELLEMRSDRARTEMDKMAVEVAGLPEDEKQIHRLRRLVELSIAWLPPDAGVGGVVDVLDLKAGSVIRWVQRKAVCY